jgi:fumarate hydratase subunit beta
MHQTNTAVPIKIQAPLSDSVIQTLRAGDIVSISGTLFTARDAAHVRMIAALEAGEPLPIEVMNQIIYYAGPCPEKPGEIIGSCGPTTSGRVDKFTPTLLEHGLKGMIGKGMRNAQVIESIIKHQAIYFGAIGGVAAKIAQTVKQVEMIAYQDLGTEAIRKLTVEDFPAIVVIDCKGNNLYQIGRQQNAQA